MGQVKQHYIEIEQRGYNDPPENCVCADHFNDRELKKYIIANGLSADCDYCERKTKSIDLSLLVEFIDGKIKRYFGDINDQNLYLASSFELDDDPKGSGFYDACGYAMPKGRHTYSFDELISETNLDIDNQKLYDDIVSCFENTEYCLNEPFVSTLNEELVHTWKQFCNIVKYEKRYTFLKTFELSQRQDSENGLEDILSEIGKSVIKNNLIKSIPLNEILYRCRVHNSSVIVANIGELASPPNESAKQNRMSPAGISMFYGAFDKDTAIVEAKSGVADLTGQDITIGMFRTIQELNVVDFTGLPQRISYYADYNYHVMRFLKSFAFEIAQKYEHDDKIHIEYAPTQVITEYFRYLFEITHKMKVDGLVYHSAQNSGKRCCVLFLDQKNCPNYLELSKFEKI